MFVLTFTPNIAGDYQVNVRFNQVEIRGMFFILIIRLSYSKIL